MKLCPICQTEMRREIEQNDRSFYSSSAEGLFNAKPTGGTVPLLPSNCQAYPTPQTCVIHWICPQCGNCISEEQSTGPISKVRPFKITKP